MPVTTEKSTRYRDPKDCILNLRLREDIFTYMSDCRRGLDW
jgi:hypothetical protein